MYDFFRHYVYARNLFLQLVIFIVKICLQIRIVPFEEAYRRRVCVGREGIGEVKRGAGGGGGQ